MTPQEYLQAVLKSQTLEEDSKELKELRKHRDTVEAILGDAFSPKPKIRYGGSMVKKTMNRESYDLDLTSYFPHTDERSLKEIFEETGKALQEAYYVQPKTSALRLQSKKAEDNRRDLRLDVVPGRFFDETETDTWLYQASGEKERLKTNLGIHVEHIRDSGVRDAIRLMKLWRVRYGLVSLKTFVLELLVVKLLKDSKSISLPDQLTLVWQTFQDEADSVSVKDPANPEGNDLSPILDPLRTALSAVASSTLTLIKNSGWEAVFGQLQEADKVTNALRSAAAVITTRSKPWA